MLATVADEISDGFRGCLARLRVGRLDLVADPYVTDRDSSAVGEEHGRVASEAVDAAAGSLCQGPVGV